MARTKNANQWWDCETCGAPNFHCIDQYGKSTPEFGFGFRVYRREHRCEKCGHLNPTAEIPHGHLSRYTRLEHRYKQLQAKLADAQNEVRTIRRSLGRTIKTCALDA